MSILACFLLALIPFAASITFNFPNITTNNSQDLLLLNAAVFTPDDGILLTPASKNQALNGSTGRATYAQKFHLWDNISNDLASFSTRFSFVIDSNMDVLYGDGLTFFLAADNTVINYGGAIGLPYDVSANVSRYPFVAVEFDTFCNPWDPATPVRDTNRSISIGDHVGININNIASVVSKKWLSNIMHGEECTASIEYYSDSKRLSVSFSGFEGNQDELENRLEYTIDLRKLLPERVIFGFSAATGQLYEKTSVRSWMFNSTEFKGDINNALAPTTSPQAVKGKNNTLRNVGLIIAGILVIVFAVLALAFFFLWRKKNNGDKVVELGSAVEIHNEIEMEASMPRRFAYGELAQSTGDFAETEKLGEGSFGGVYKGFLKDLRHVAVKRVSKTSKQGMKEYAAEVKIISRLRHKNLVQLIGWCHEQGEFMLVYEFMENGSLDLHLFKGKSSLTWNTRYRISLGLASAVQYLHEDWEQCVLHRDIKSSNLMLDSNFNAKLGDFGLAKLVDHENGDSQTTLVLAGTMGYMAPEYAMSGKASKESDVFSFGVVILEIACGRQPIQLDAPEEKQQLVEWVWDLYGTDTLLEAADPRMGSDFSEAEIKRMMIVGLWCAYPDSNLRPSMKQAIKVLNTEAPPPILPSKMPKVTYNIAPPTSSSYGDTSSSGWNTASSNVATSSTLTQS